MSIFSNRRQFCTAGSRLFLHEKLHDKVLEKVIEAAKKVRLGYQMDPATTMGPLSLGRSRRIASSATSKAASRTPNSSMAEKSRKGWKTDISSVQRSSTRCADSMKIAREEI